MKSADAVGALGNRTLQAMTLYEAEHFRRRPVRHLRQRDLLAGLDNAMQESAVFEQLTCLRQVEGEMTLQNRHGCECSHKGQLHKPS